VVDHSRGHWSPGVIAEPALGRELADDPTQVIEVPSKTILGVNDHHVALANEAEHGRQLRPVPKRCGNATL